MADSTREPTPPDSGVRPAAGATGGGARPETAGPAQPTTIGPASLQAPWRLQYLEEMGKAEAAAGGPPKVGSGSFLLDYWLDPAGDERHHVIVRTGEGLILLNGFPYANGHLLVALGEARGRLGDYTASQRAALWGLVELAAELMERTLEPQGINFGINQGRAAGAGVPQHLHVHLVPRWSGDVNFMSVVGQVRVIPSSLAEMWGRYRGAWKAMGGT
jgi:ATP adenylyltransferase